MKYLFLDDTRVPSDVTWMYIGTSKAWHDGRGAPWNIVRSYNEAVAWVLENGFPDVISFDHDLGYEEFDTTESGMIVVTNATVEKSGHDFAKWLVEYDMDTNSMPDDFRFTVHSKNPEGTKNIQGLLNNYLKFKGKR